MKSLERERGEVNRRRAFLVMGAQGLLLTALGARLFHLQVLEQDKYKKQALDNHINQQLITPQRGRVLDRFGKILIDNRRVFALQIIPEQIGRNGLPNALDQVGKVVELSDEQKQLLIERASQQRGFIPLTIATDLDWDIFSKINMQVYDLPGVQLVEARKRYYPLAHITAPITGYVGRVSREDQSEASLFSMPDFRIGKQGIEQIYDQKLRGVAGLSRQEINARGRVINIRDETPAEPGTQISLTIDADLQKLAFELLQSHRAGSAILLDCTNGAVRALANTPSYDPNLFVDGISKTAWNQLLNDPLNPLLNRAISGLYAPGSTFKIITLLGVMQAGLNPYQKHLCQGHIDYADHRFHCWKEEGHGLVDGIEAMRESCDVWFYLMAQKLGINKIADTAKLLGLGAKTGIDIPQEKSGVVASSQWKKQALGQGWVGGETLINAIGQGYQQTTPLQLAVMMARLVAAGKPITPYLYHNLKNDDQSVENTDRLNDESDGEQNLISPNHLKIILHALREVVAHPRGTAHRALYQQDGIGLLGKTGTSQVRRISAAEREEGIRKGEDIDWHLRDHALFVGLAPATRPRYATAVVIDHGGSGSSVAAPIAGELLRRAVAKDKDKDSFASHDLILKRKVKGRKS